MSLYLTESPEAAQKRGQRSFVVRFRSEIVPNKRMFHAYVGILFGRIRTPENKPVKPIMRPPKPCAVTLSRTRDTIICKPEREKVKSAVISTPHETCDTYLTKECERCKVKSEEQVVKEKLIRRYCKSEHEVEYRHKHDARKDNKRNFGDS